MLTIIGAVQCERIFIYCIYYAFYCSQVFMEEMTRKQPDVDKVTKTYKRKPAEAPSSLAERRGARESPFSGFY